MYTDNDDALRALHARFEQLTQKWKTETGMLSRVDKKCMHPAYQEIIGMGSTAIPWILKDLKATRGHWFWALRAISGEDPVQDEDVGDAQKMIEAWLAWGRNRGHNV
jgi:hypothetical protein